MLAAPPDLTTTSDASIARLANPAAWPTTSTVDWGRLRSAAATLEHPSSSRCCSTCVARPQQVDEPMQPRKIFQAVVSMLRPMMNSILKQQLHFSSGLPPNMMPLQFQHLP